MTDIYVALIGGLAVAIPSVIATVLTNKSNTALTNYKIEELTKEVKEHNNFAKRMPVVEEQIKVINHRIDDLEKGR
ncbi:MAG: hypothetical protein MJ245_00340 [Clostridia bacterium]|nr:hypothetical protein [Clostridia bacterium]